MALTTKPQRILRNDKKYGPFTGRPNMESLPREVLVSGTLEQARWVAQTLSNCHAGCDRMFYVEGDE